MLEKTKEVEINKRRYQLHRFTAETGSWVAYMVMTKILPSWVGAALPATNKSGGAELSEEDFRKIQQYCLRYCFEISEGAPIRVILDDGRWANPELAYDLPTVMALTTHALMFNLAPLFNEDAFSEGLTGLLGTIPTVASSSVTPTVR